MIEQAKLLRVFTLIRLLKRQPGRTLPELAQALDCHPRTITRYLALLEEIGYFIDEDAQRRKFIFEAEPDEPSYFSPEEIGVMRQALTALDLESPLGESLRRKLYLTSELIPLADELLDMHQGRVVQQLVSAIKDRCRVRLLRYQSPNSGTVRDREVEPLALTDNYAQLNAVEVESGQLRTYKIRRIEAIEVLATPCDHAASEEHLDVFGMTGPAWLPVTLRLTARAYRLLVEEHAAARSFVLPDPLPASDLSYRFRGEVRSYLGIGRFVLGLPTEVEVVEPTDFRAFLREKAGRARW
jgi:proteasome accessory factor C